MLISLLTRVAGIAALFGLAFSDALLGAHLNPNITPTKSSAIANAGLSANQIVLEDFTDIVTPVDLGFNDFSGSTGLLNKDGRPYGQTTLNCPVVPTCTLQLTWDFSIFGDLEAFTGAYHSLFGLTSVSTTLDGTTVVTTTFPEHTLDLNRIDGVLNEPGGPRSIQSICFELSYQGAATLKLRTELKDARSPAGIRFTRFDVPNASTPQTSCWNFRALASYMVPAGSLDLDLSRAKELTFIVERNHFGDNVHNPTSGTLSFRRIWFEANRGDVLPDTDQDLLDLLERRTYQYFLDWSSRKPESLDIPQDRSTFNYLLTVGGIGFGLPAHIIAAERGWITRAEAVTRILNVLRTLDNPNAFGSERVGRIGYQGFLYHFFGADGRRKLNFDFPETSKNEALNTVELSTIDTGLALMGVLAAQSYFVGTDSKEAEIRQHAQAIYDRVNWPFMLEPASQQFYLGWKPNEPQDGSFDIPDAQGQGKYSGISDNPHTLDYYTDEALIVILLAAGSPTHPVSSETYRHVIFDPSPQGLIRTYPGSLFTFEFLHPFIDTRDGCPWYPYNWYANSRLALFTAIAYVTANPDGFATYGPDAWGVSAAEGPTDEYHAYGLPPLAVNPDPEEDGTATYYAMMSAASFGDDLRQKAISALRKAWERGHWHSRFGLPDAFHVEISQALPMTPTGYLRQTGSWKQRALFAIDQGPMLLHLENARSGLIWRLMAQNPNIQRGLSKLNRLYVCRFLPLAVRD